ncbi:MAG TPA: glucuronate isomerase [Caulobacteraceae bacterium]
MSHPLRLDPARFFPAEPRVRAIAQDLFAEIETLPIVSPHGHADPAWFASDASFDDAPGLIVIPDHYLLRMLASQGVGPERLGVRPLDGGAYQTDRRAAWRCFAEHYHLFRGTPSRLWLDHAFAEVFGLDVRLEAATADHYFDTLAAALAEPGFRPRALFERFRIEALATTEGALDPLTHHAKLRDSGWRGRVIPTFRPDDITDPDRPGFLGRLATLGGSTNEDTTTWSGLLAALAARRAFFRLHGATATDHGPPSAMTADLGRSEAQALLDRLMLGRPNPGDAELFRAQMLTEMAAMSFEDRMVMQLHPGARRDHNPEMLKRFGRDMGWDIPTKANFVDGLKPLLDRFGNAAGFTLVLFTLDRAVWARDLAPLAGAYPCLRLGAPWWFNDSFDGMISFRRQVTETVGFYNTVGFADDTRAFISIPARHDLARRIDCAFLAELVATHRLELDEAAELARDLAHDLAKAAYKL